MSYQHCFSKQAADYARFRPTYPNSLYEYLVSVTTAQGLVWDCGTGNGQAAVALARFFREVVATDVSEAQIRQGMPSPRVRYEVAPAEKAPLADGSADLVTVAQAVHWFDLDRFYSEVKRVGAPGSVVALWGYGFFRTEEPIHGIVDRFGRETLKPYWPDRIHYVQNGYRDLPFPFAPLEAPRLSFSLEWSLPMLRGYLSSWSATQKYKDAHGGRDPFDLIREPLEGAWGEPSVLKRFIWDIPLLVGRIHPR
jgi:SAM-dependent methyltransferase